MKTSEFDYDLPAERIAQEPAARRDRSRLLVLDRDDGRVAHRRFDELPTLLSPGDLVVMNDTRVRPARLWGRKATGGRVELTLVEPAGADGSGRAWIALIRAARRPAPGSVLELDGGLTATVGTPSGEGVLVELSHPADDPAGAVERVGTMPLPPYIRRGPDDPRHRLDRERYQTVFARRPGAVAAPTAGLHFTSELLARLADGGIEQASLTLHVGIGTFRPVRVADIERHRLHAEDFRIPEATAVAVERARARGARVVAVGTTVVRALEAVAADHGRVRAARGRCDLFIRPGFPFRVVDALVTNFHLPRSTLLMLVGAFAGTARVLSAYREAIRLGYRFYSYGDAMLIGSDLPPGDRAAPSGG